MKSSWLIGKKLSMKDLLKTTRELLSQLGTEVVSIANEYSDVFSDTTINEQLNRFRLAYEDAITNLDSPTFRIATIGTTSSGKSTIINALIGRKVAPMEADEMSAGILTLSSSDESKMIIEEVEGAVWETGEWVGVSDEDLYTHIRDRVMLPYHEKRKLKELPAPQITVLGSLLPVDDPSLLNLPSGVNIEFVDLPGLKSVQDRTNLKVIQKRVNKAFSLVALDYGQVDEQHRRQLLEELKKVVSYLQGRTDSMIFILNRVDLRNSVDLPLEERIAKLQVEIQDILSLPKLPDIIPFSSLLLYYAQSAWGTKSLSESSSVAPDKRSQLLKYMFADCSGIIKQYTQGNRPLKNWFRDIEDSLEDGEAVDDEAMRQILQYALSWSGGEEFWACLRDRLLDSFPVLVIAPILASVLEVYQALSASVDSVAETRKLKTIEEVNSKRIWVTQRRKELNLKIQQSSTNFSQDIELIIEDLKKSSIDVDREIKLTTEFKKGGLQGFSDLLDAVQEVEKDLNAKLKIPVRDALKNHLPTHELEEKLSQVINPSLTRELIKAYDIASRRLTSFTKFDEGFLKEVREDDEQSIKDVEHDERAVRKLYQAMRTAMSSRAEFMLQAQSKKFEDSVQSLINKRTIELIVYAQEILPDFNMGEAIIADFKRNMSNNTLTLPSDKLFALTDPVIVTPKTVDVKIGEEQAIELRESGSCFKSIEPVSVTRDVMEEVVIRQIILPDFDTMADQWSTGVENARSILWNSLKDWIVKYMSSTNIVLKQSINEILDLVERSLQDQINILENNLNTEIAMWEKLESRNKSLQIIVDQLNSIVINTH
jgi:GTPase SAR1 family protein